MYPFALERGITPDIFWQSSVLELLDMMSAYDKMRETKFKDSVYIGFATADAIATRVGSIFTDPKKRRDAKITQPWDSFPELFTREQEKAQEREENADMELYKANMRAFADRWNRRNKDVSKDSL